MALKFSVLGPYNFGASGSIPTKLLPYNVPQGRSHNIVKMFGRPAPKIWEDEKIHQNSARFLTTFDFDREYLRNDSRNPKSQRTVIDSDSSCHSVFHEKVR